MKFYNNPLISIRFGDNHLGSKTLLNRLQIKRLFNGSDCTESGIYAIDAGTHINYEYRRIVDFGLTSTWWVNNKYGIYRYSYDVIPEIHVVYLDLIGSNS